MGLPQLGSVALIVYAIALVCVLSWASRSAWLKNQAKSPRRRKWDKKISDLVLARIVGTAILALSGAISVLFFRAITRYGHIDYMAGATLVFMFCLGIFLAFARSSWFRGTIRWLEKKEVL